MGAVIKVFRRTRAGGLLVELEFRNSAVLVLSHAVGVVLDEQADIRTMVPVNKLEI